MNDRISHLRQGQRFTAQTTAKVRGQRIYRTQVFTASRDQDVEPFDNHDPDNHDPDDIAPPQDRVFVEQASSIDPTVVVSAPELVVWGTIRLEADQ